MEINNFKVHVKSDRTGYVSVHTTDGRWIDTGIQLSNISDDDLTTLDEAVAKYLVDHGYTFV